MEFRQFVWVAPKSRRQGRAVRGLSCRVLMTTLVLGTAAIAAQAGDLELRGAAWVADAAGLAKITTPTLGIAAENQSYPNLRAVTVDVSRRVVWAFSPPNLIAYDFSGQVIATTAVSASGTTYGLVVDPADGSVWLAVGANLLLYSSGGSPLASTAAPADVTNLLVDPYRNLWISTANAVLSYDALTGARLAGVDDLGKTAKIADIILYGSDLWVGLSSSVREYSLVGNGTADFYRAYSIHGVRQLAEYDPYHLKISTGSEVLDQALYTFNDTLSSDGDPFPGHESIVGMIADQSAGGLWLYSDQGRVLHEWKDIQYLDLGASAPIFDLAIFPPETTAPQLAVTDPLENGWMSPTGFVDLTYSDPGSGIDLATVALTDCTCSAEPVAAVCTPTAPFTGATRSLTASVRDYAGNSAEVIRNVRIDSLPPVVTILDPADGTSTANPRPTVRAEASDNDAGLDPATVDVMLDGQPVPADCSWDGTMTTCMPTVDFGAGPHILGVRIADEVGNLGSATVAISVEPASDETPPTVDWLSPSAGARTSNTFPALKISYDDTSGIDPKSFVLSLDGEVIDADCELGPHEASCIPLNAVGRGDHFFGGQIADISGNVASLPPLLVSVLTGSVTILGSVVDVAGNPVADALVWSTSDPHQVATTQADGSYVLVARATAGSGLHMVARLGSGGTSSGGSSAELTPSFDAPVEAQTITIEPACPERFEQAVAIDSGIDQVRSVWFVKEADAGSGPSLYVGGDFTELDGVVANDIAEWTAGGWESLGGGLGPTNIAPPVAMETFDDGSGLALFVGGAFGEAGGVGDTSGIARWDGTRWSSVGGGVDGAVSAMTIFDDGAGPALYVSGSFTTAGGAPVSHIARWDGQSWQSLAEGFSASINELAVLETSSGPRLVAVGGWNPNGEVDHRLALWDGRSWTEIGGLTSTDYVTHIVVDHSGPIDSLVVFGSFSRIGGITAGGKAKWDQTAWSDMSGGWWGTSTAVLAFDDGTKSRILASAESPNQLLEWGGTAWAPLPGGTFDDYPTDLASAIDGQTGLPTETLVAGWFDVVGSWPMPRLARLRRSCVPLDRTAPVIHLDSPPLDLVTKQTNVQIAGSLSEPAQVAVNGTSVQLDGALHFDLGLVPLSPGLNSFTFEAMDGAGNRSRLGLQVVRDETAPTLAISAPQSGDVVWSRRPPIKLTYADDVAVDVSSLRITANGADLSVSCTQETDGRSCTPLEDLSVGSLHLEAALSDEAGNAAAAQTDFVIDPAAGPAPTAITGRVEFVGGLPAAGVSILILGRSDLAASTGSDGSFEIPSVELLDTRPLAIVARLQTIDGELLAVQENLSPIPGGVTDAGVLLLRPRCDLQWDTTFAGGPGVDGIYPEESGGGADSYLAPRVYAMTVWDDGAGPALYVAGQFKTAGGRPAGNIARWNGRSWSTLATPGGAEGANLPIHALAVFDGDLIVGGDFTAIAGVPANHVAAWNGTNWTALGGGVDSGGLATSVRALAVSNGLLYVGGNFQTADGAAIAASNIASWDGSTWRGLSGGVGSPNESVFALSAFGRELYVGGNFTTANGATMWRIARWTGSRWKDVGGGVGATSGSYLYAQGVYSFASYQGDLYVGGTFGTVGPEVTSGFESIARWDGRKWHVVPAAFHVTGVAEYESQGIQSLLSFDDGSGPVLYAAGAITFPDGTPTLQDLARWDGSSWSEVGHGAGYGSRWGGVALASFDTDGSGPESAKLIVGNASRAAGGWTVPADGIAAWDGNVWSSLGEGVAYRNTFIRAAGPDGAQRLFVNDELDIAPQQFDGSGVKSIPLPGAAALGGFVSDVRWLDLGDGPRYYVSGSFTRLGPWSAGGVASFDGSSWSPLGDGIGDEAGGTRADIETLAEYDDGHGMALYAGGGFESIPGELTSMVARWDGEQWLAVGSGITAQYPTYAGVWILRSYSPPNAGPLLVAGGRFDTADGQPAANIAAWDGERWKSLGAGVDGDVDALTMFDDGSGPVLYVGGWFTHAGGLDATGIARWDGSTWSTLPPLDGGVTSIVPFDPGDGPALYVSGTFTHAGGVAANGYAKWDGTRWSAVSTDFHTVNVRTLTGTILPRLAVFDDGLGDALYVGGDLERSAAPGVPIYLARLYHPLDCIASDKTKPVVHIDSPGADAVLTTSRPELDVSYSDTGSGADPTSLKFTVDGQPLPTSCQPGAFSAICVPGMDLADGQRTIAVTIADGAGHASDLASVSATVDVHPPDVSFDTPPDGSFVLTSTPTFHFEMSDEGVGVDPTTVSIRISAAVDAGLSCTYDVTGGTCSAPSPLQDTPLTLYVSVSDRIGHRTSDASATYYIDTTAPALRIVSPAPGSTLYTSPESMQLAISEVGSGPDPGSVVAELDGSPLPVACTFDAAGASCALPGPFADGPHELDVSLADRAGRRSEVARSAFTLLLDAQKPTIGFSIPIAGAAFDPQATPLQLTWSDDVSGVDPSTLLLFADGRPLQVNCESSEAGASCLSVERPSGEVTMTARVSDRAGHVSDDAGVSFTVPPPSGDTTSPLIEVTEPSRTSVGSSPVTLRGTVSEPSVLTIDGNAVALSSDLRFAATISLVNGGNTIELRAIDPSGNVGALTVDLELDETAPAGLDPSLLTVAPSADGIAPYLGAVGSVPAPESGDAIVARNARTGASSRATVQPDGSFAGQAPGLPGDEVDFVVSDGAGNESAAVSRTLSGAEPVPSAPDPTIPGTDTGSPFCRRYSFVWSGPASVQYAGAAGAIDCQRATVIRGRAVDSAGNPLGGVLIGAPREPAVGDTLSRADGVFDFALNGGGDVDIRFEKTGYLPVVRRVDTRGHDLRALADVVLMAKSTVATLVTLAPSNGAQVVKGEVTSDLAGTRRAVLVVPSGTSAQAEMQDGRSSPMGALTIRATELTVGNDPARSLPGPLPAGHDPTYVVDYSADEADELGADHVLFDRPLPAYVEDFVNVPVGTPVAVASWDSSALQWRAEEDGRVIEILSTANGAAQLDVSGGGVAADVAALTALGIDSEELGKLAALYPDGTKLLRWRVRHFSTYYAGFGYLLAADQVYGPPESLPLPSVPDERRTTHPQLGAFGGLIDGENQILGESLPIMGTPLALVYGSDRVPGRRAPNTLLVPVTGDAVDPNVRSIEVEIEANGKSQILTFEPAPNLSYTYTWDGADGWGQTLGESGTWTVRVTYLVDTILAMEPPTDMPLGTTSFDLPGGQSITGDPRGLWRFTRETFGTFPAFDAREAFGLGGWSIDVLDRYDPSSRTLYFGDGRRGFWGGGPESRLAMYRVAGTGSTGSDGDGGPARDAELWRPAGLSVTNDGSLLIADAEANRVRRVDRNGLIDSLVGGNCTDPLGGPLGDGGPAKDGCLLHPRKAVEDAVGNVFIADSGHHRVRKIDAATGLISTYVDLDTPSCMPHLYDLDVDDSGAVWIAAVNSRFEDYQSPCAGVWKATEPGSAARVGDDGTWYANLNLRGLDVTPGGLVRLSAWNCVYAMSATGTMTDAFPGASSGACGIIAQSADDPDVAFRGDGQHATYLYTRYANPNHLAVARDGTTYVADTLNARVRAIGPDGIINTVIGGGPARGIGDAAQPTAISLTTPYGIALSKDDRTLYVSDSYASQVWAMRLAAPKEGTIYEVPSEDGSEIYVFDLDGYHLRTESAATRRAIWTFAYATYPGATPSSPPRRLVTGIEDAFGNSVTIERNATGEAQAIIGPFGQTTMLTMDGNGYLADVSRTVSSTVEHATMTSESDGLIDTLQNPNGGTYTYQWDLLGRLATVGAPGGESVAVATSNESTQGRSVSLTSAMGRSSGVDIDFEPDRSVQWTDRPPVGPATVSRELRDGTYSTATPGLGQQQLTTVPDVLYGPLVDSWSQSTTTLPSGRTSFATLQTTAASDPSDRLATARRTDRLTVDGRTRTSIYDRSSRTLTTTSPAGRTAVAHLDAYERIASLDSPGLPTTSYSYDARGRLQQIAAGTRTTTYAYAPSGYLASVTDALGRTVHFDTDEAGRVTKEILPDQEEIAFGYDQDGNVVSVTPPTRPSHDFGYTPVDQLESYTPPDVGYSPRATLYGYNSDGQLLSITRPDGQQVLYTYGATTGRLESVTLPSGEINMSYDAEDRVASVTAPSGEQATYAYDGPLVTGVTFTGPVPGNISIERNAQFEVSSAEISGAPWTRADYAYDADGLLTQAGGLSLTRDATTGFLTGTAIGVISDSRIFTSYGEIDTYAATAGSTPLYGYHLDRDTAGRIVKKTETIAGATTVWEYAYDPDRGWLTEVKKDGVVVETYAYDANGNRTSWTDFWGSGTATYDAQDRLLQARDTTYTYTPNGELLTSSTGGAVNTYTYDVAGSLLRVDLPTGISLECLTDAAGRRIGRSVNGVLTQGWIYGASSAPIAETDGAGALTTRYVYASEGTVPEYMIRDGQTYRFITDQLGSVRLVVNAADETIAQEIDYDAFGRITYDSNPGFQPFGFAGGMYDSQTQLVRFGARDYDPETGRWTSKDPIGFAGGSAGLYTYVENDPVNLVDPDGLEVGEPGFWEGLIPIWGSGRAAINDFQTGHYIWGSVNTVLAASDVFLVRSLVTGVGKLGWKAAGSIAARETEAGSVKGLLPRAAVPLGKWGETRLAQVLGGAGVKPAKAFMTSRGARYVDRLVNGIAHEAKAGINVALRSRIRTQVLKDVELIEAGRIRGAHWHFFQGAEQGLLDYLTENGIAYTLH